MLSLGSIPGLGTKIPRSVAKKKPQNFCIVDMLICLCNLETGLLFQPLKAGGAQKIFCESTHECYDNLSIV